MRSEAAPGPETDALAEASRSPQEPRDEAGRGRGETGRERRRRAHRAPALVEEVIHMSEEREHSLLGKLLDEIAQARGVQGPEAISDHLWKQAQFDVSEESVYEYLQGYDWPPPDIMVAFKESFDLNEREAGNLAWLYAFHERRGGP